MQTQACKVIFHEKAKDEDATTQTDCGNRVFVTVVLCHGQRATFTRKVLNQAAFSGPRLEEDCVIVTIVLCHKWWVAFGRLVLHQAAFGGTWLEQ